MIAYVMVGTNDLASAVELYDGPTQNITAFNPPEIIKNRKDQ